MSMDKVKTLNPTWDESKRKNRTAAVENEEGEAESWADDAELEHPYVYDDPLN